MKLSSLHTTSVNEALKGTYDVYVWDGSYAYKNVPDKEMILIQPRHQIQTTAASPVKAINNAVYRILESRLKRKPMQHEIAAFRSGHYIRAFPEPVRKTEFPQAPKRSQQLNLF